MQTDLELKTKQTTWETPRNIAALAAAMAVVMGTIFGVLGYKIGQQPLAQIVQYPPGTVVTITVPPAPK